MIHSSSPLAAIAIRQVENHTGASRNAFEQTKALKELGYQVVILAERGNYKQVERKGAYLVKLPRWPVKGPFRRFWFNSRVRAWCKRNRPNLLISHGDAESCDVIYMHNCVHLASQRINGTLLPKNHETASIHDHILKKKNFKLIVVNSILMAKDLQQRYDINEAQIEVGYPGYEQDIFNVNRAQEPRRKKRFELGVNEGDYLIGLITSGDFKKRNVAGFIEICKEVNNVIPNRCRFLVVGKDNPKPYQLQTEKAGIENLFIWRPTVPNVEHFYGALDAFVLPAHIEEFGRVALEAMACGTPVLLSSWVGASELIRGPFPNLVIDTNDRKKWAEKIISILQDSNRYSMGIELASFASNYSHHHQLQNLKNSFRSLEKVNKNTRNP